MTPLRGICCSRMKPATRAKSAGLSAAKRSFSRMLAGWTGMTHCLRN
jgi:hypothetical protein